MVTDTQHDDPVLLGEADAIVAAEWIRLHHDEETWDRELAELFAEMPTPEPPAPQSRTTTLRGRPGAAPPSHPKGVSLARRCHRLRVWATQRSPPASTARLLVEKRWRATEVMP
ncbi:MAG: hypothetical protein QOJ20_2576 [Mycobacterium sp.]|jgi:hypothetical protein|nr:hypothetical protein [Mycobacterium sp.]MDT5281381.1 hypothetical protein [Mycobacterium sp.]